MSIRSVSFLCLLLAMASVRSALVEVRRYVATTSITATTTLPTTGTTYLNTEFVEGACFSTDSVSSVCSETIASRRDLQHKKDQLIFSEFKPTMLLKVEPTRRPELNNLIARLSGKREPESSIDDSQFEGRLFPVLAYSFFSQLFYGLTRTVTCVTTKFSTSFVTSETLTSSINNVTVEYPYTCINPPDVPFICPATSCTASTTNSYLSCAT